MSIKIGRISHLCEIHLDCPAYKFNQVLFLCPSALVLSRFSNRSQKLDAVLRLCGQRCDLLISLARCKVILIGIADPPRFRALFLLFVITFLLALSPLDSWHTLLMAVSPISLGRIRGQTLLALTALLERAHLNHILAIVSSCKSIFLLLVN